MEKEQKTGDAENIRESSVEEDDLTDDDVFWSRFVLGGCFAINFISDGCAYSFGVLLTDLLEYFGENKSKTSWIGSLFMGVPLLCGPLASMISTRIGIRAATIGGGVIFFVGFLASSFVQSVEMLYLTYGIIAGFGMSLPYLNTIVIITHYFRKRIAFATGVSECAAGVGTIVFAPLTELLLSTYGWRGTMYILSGFAANVIVCGALFRPISRKRTIRIDEQRVSLVNKKECSNNESSNCANGTILKRDTSTDEPSETSHRDSLLGDLDSDLRVEIDGATPKSNSICWLCYTKRLKHIIKHLNLSIFRNPLYIIFIVSCLILYVWFDTPYVYLANRAIGCGMTAAQGAWLVSVIGLTHTVGNLVFGFIGDVKRLSLPIVYGVSIATAGASLTVIPSTFTFIPMATMAGVYGLMSAASEALSSMLLIDILGKENLSQSYGFTMLLKGIANLGGPPLAGWLFDISGNYDNTFYASGACIVVAGLIYIPTACLRKYVNYRK